MFIFYVNVLHKRCCNAAAILSDTPNRSHIAAKFEASYLGVYGPRITGGTSCGFELGSSESVLGSYAKWLSSTLVDIIVDVGAGSSNSSIYNLLTLDDLA